MPIAKVISTLFRARRFNVEQVVQKDDDGQEHERHVVRHPGAVVILPMVDREHICLIRNYRVAVDQTLWELPAGTLEPDEPVEETAARELIEETGYEAGQLRLIHQFWMSPGILDEKMYFYLATELSDGDSALEAGEQIVRAVKHVDEVDRMLRDGEIRDAKTLAALLFYFRYLR